MVFNTLGMWCYLTSRMQWVCITQSHKLHPMGEPLVRIEEHYLYDAVGISSAQHNTVGS